MIKFHGLKRMNIIRRGNLDYILSVFLLLSNTEMAINP